MKKFSGKILLVAVGAVVGAAGYLAWRNREELHELLGAASDNGKEFVEKEVGELSAQPSAREEGGK